MKLQDISPLQAKDAALAITAVFLLLFLFLGNKLWCYIALGFCFFSLLVPAGLRLFAWIWYSLSQCLGSIVLKIILTISFIFLVLPVGLCQRLFGRNSMGLKDWHGKGSLLHDRNYTYSKKDFEKTW